MQVWKSKKEIIQNKLDHYFQRPDS
jgi:hypothetical protein